MRKLIFQDIFEVLAVITKSPSDAAAECSAAVSSEVSCEDFFVLLKY
ncbi:MAG: hypothetical protein PHY90_11215 [Desulfitobacteriaceae bacterium]|nr:hypothetical protein [Desulfitobacteriaceae bacterium]